MRRKLQKPNGLVGLNGKDPIGPLDILPFLPDQECFFDSRHWIYDTLDGVLPFAVTTRIAVNCQQYLKIYEDTDTTSN